MKIGIEAQRLFRRKKHGMDIVVLETLRALQRLDRENTYVVFVRPGKDNACLQPSANLEIREVEARSYATWEQIALPRAVREAGVDVLHCTSNTAPLRSPVPVVLTLHDVIYLERRSLMHTGGTWYQRLGNLYRRWVVPAAARQAARVVTVSAYERNRIQETLPMLKEKLSVAYNGVGSHFQPVDDPVEQAAVRDRYGLPERFLFFLGNTDPKKNLPNVIEAYVRYARRAPEALPLVIADYREDRLLRRLRALDALDLRGQFVLPGYVANADLPAVYSQCALFLYPSLRESFGIPILEAMACGAPVVTANRASMPEVAGDAARLVDPEDPEETAGAIEDVLGDAAEARRWQRRGRERAAEFSWEATARQLQPLYASAVSASRALLVEA